MTSSFATGPTVGVFSCPNCRETINTSMTVCRFCGTAIDSERAASDAALTSRITQAYSDSSFLKSLLISQLVFLGLAFVPLLSLIGGAGFLVCLVAVPVLCIRWWVRNGRIESKDPDYLTARRRAIWASAIGGSIVLYRLLSLLIWHR